MHWVQILEPKPESKGRQRTVIHRGAVIGFWRRPFRHAARYLLEHGLADEDDELAAADSTVYHPRRVADAANLSVEELDGPIYGRQRPERMARAPYPRKKFG